MLGVDELSEEDKVIFSRARRIQQFLSQNTHLAKQFTGVDGSDVPLRDTIEGFKGICDGEFDHIPEQAFFNRSEERRVGKEGRSRWSTYPEKKTRAERKKCTLRLEELTDEARL